MATLRTATPPAFCPPGVRSVQRVFDCRIRAGLVRQCRPVFSRLPECRNRSGRCVGVRRGLGRNHLAGTGLDDQGRPLPVSLRLSESISPHAWDFATNSLMYDAEFGGAYTQNGAQVRWVATDRPVHGIRRGIRQRRQLPQHPLRAALGDYTLFSHFGGDVGVSNSWTAACRICMARHRIAKAGLTDLNGNPAQTLFNGNSKTGTRLRLEMGTRRQPDRTVLQVRGRIFLARRAGQSGVCGHLATGVCVMVPPAPTPPVSPGGYLQGVYQFMPRWRVGYRYDRLKRWQHPLRHQRCLSAGL